jgi:tetratricopeptide (TPR) repeat protein
MFRRSRQFRYVTTLVLIAAFWLTPLRASGQDLIAVSSITGGSVFVFRAISRGVKRIAQTFRPARTKTQRNESTARVKKQYETIARTNPKKDREGVTEPTKLPGANSLPAGQAAKIFAGVGEYYIQQHDLDNAIDKFRDALSLNPGLTAAKLGLSEALALKGTDQMEKDKNVEAKASFLEALTYDAKNSAAYFGLGEVYSELNQTSEAIANYEKSLENDKGLTEIYVPLGILYFQTGQIAKAD